MTTEDRPNYTLSYNDGPETQQKAYDVLLKYFKEAEHFCGESINQSDSTYVDAPDLLTELA